MNTYTNVEIAAMLGVNRTALSAWLRAHEADIPGLSEHTTLRGKRKAYDLYAIKEICRLRKVDVPVAVEEPAQTTLEIKEESAEIPAPEVQDAQEVQEEPALALSPEERIAQLEAENAALKEYLARYINDFTNQAEAITELLSENGKIKVKKLKKKYAKLLEAKKNQP